MDTLFLILGLVLILGGANFLTDGAAAMAQRFRVPEFIVGLTVVAVGTSMPELVVSVLSAIAGNSDVAVGNVVGSNLFNILVILGICALITPILLNTENIRRDIPIGMAASVLLFLIASDHLLHTNTADTISRADGIAMLIIYIGIMWYTVRTTPRPAVGDTSEKKMRPLWMSGVMIVGGLAALIFGGEMFLHGATALARKFGIAESVIAITLVAGGTSLPELASGIIAMVKGKAEMALGNVIGSCVANILLILGLSATIHPLSMGGITTADLGMLMLSSALLFVTAFTFRRRAIDRWEGAIFIAIYAVYIYFLLK